MAITLVKPDIKTQQHYMALFALEGAKAMLSVGEYDTCESAFKTSRSAVEYYFPNLTCPDSERVFSIHDAETDKDVGQLWLSILKDGDSTKVFLSYIMIEEEFKRNGYATQTLDVMEDYIKNTLNINRIEFYSFVNNPVAHRMYLKHGYTVFKKQFFGYATDTTRNVMAKDL
jgi:RimJ/RimL family protein N-acetyltransferase